jgi:hypothetical protein
VAALHFVGDPEATRLGARQNLGGEAGHRRRNPVIGELSAQAGRGAPVAWARWRGNYRFVCVPAPGVEPEGVVERLRLVYGIHTQARVQLPSPLPRMIRNWVRAFRLENLHHSLANLEEAIIQSP